MLGCVPQKVDLVFDVNFCLIVDHLVECCHFFAIVCHCEVDLVCKVILGDRERILKSGHLVDCLGQVAVEVCVLPSLWVASVFQIVQILENGPLYYFLGLRLGPHQAFGHHFEQVLPLVVRQLPEESLLLELCLTQMLLVLTLVVLDRACNTADDILEDAFDEHSSKVIEIVVGFVLADCLGEILLRRCHVLEYSP
jgi:hypothetical protein